jgi:peptide/nickel transport system substrate-binding protein
VKKQAYMALMGSALLLFMASCKTTTREATSFPRSETLYLAGFQWAEPSTFNPLSDWPDWPINGNYLLYESLLTFNPLTGAMEPRLARSLSRTDTSFIVELHPEARWNNGTPVTGHDVHFSYAIGKRYAEVPVSFVWEHLSDIKVTTLVDSITQKPESYPRQIEFIINMRRNNPLVVKDLLQSVHILPSVVFEHLLDSVGGNIAEFKRMMLDKNPVVSGPYTIHSYSNQQIAVVRNEQYWGNDVLYDGKKPAPKFIIHPIYRSNDHFSIALQQGRLDISATFIPRIWLKARKGVRTWYDDVPFFFPASIPMLTINHARAPLNDVNLRRAMAYAIHYDDIRELAVSGYSEPLQPGLIIPFGLESHYFFAEDAKKYGTYFNTEKAKSVLHEAGYKSIFDARGNLVEMLDKNGNRVPTLFIKSPAGWGDWESIVRIAVRSMRAAGIDVRERFIDAGLYYQNLPMGDFDLIMNTPRPEMYPSQPWSRFEALLTTVGLRPLGDRVNKNQGRFNAPERPGYIPAFDSLLAVIPRLEEEADKIRAYRQLNALFMQHQPSLPLLYRPDQFYEFSTRHWVNFPTSENPYSAPQLPGYGNGLRILWNLKPASH